MPTKYFWSILTLLLLLFGGCGESQNKTNPDGTSSGTSAQPFTTGEKAYVYQLFQTEYLWFDQVAQDVDYQTFSTPQEMVESLRVNPPDRWSFMITAEEYERYLNQQTSGFGFGYVQGFKIYQVRIDSPADGRLFRGDIITHINGKPVSDTLIASASKHLGTAATFTLNRAGSIMDVKVTPSVYPYRVTRTKIIEYDGLKVGYLRYDAFSASSVAELETAFTYLKSANIQRLVIDLRYNSGGDVSVASALLDNITNAHAGEIQFILDWNENNKEKDSTYTFEDAALQDGNELAMNQVVFLTTADSASASELVISALKPYLGNSNVITIGSATHGKNVGMEGRAYGNNYYFLINFYVKNAAGMTTSFYGIPPTCAAQDDLDHLLGDPQEQMLHTALHYIATGSCL